MRTFKLFLLVLMGCFEPAQFPFTAEWFVAPPAYRIWWNEVEVCAKIYGSVNRISWYMVPGNEFVASNGEIAWGQWISPHNIFIVEGQLDAEYIVKHEMLHDLLGGDANHSSNLWDRCV